MKIIILFLLILISCSSPKKNLENMPYHHTHDGFRNLPGSPEREFSFDSFWFYPSRPFATLFEDAYPKDHVIAPEQALEKYEELVEKDSVTWLGHMATVVRIDEKVILIDPWLSDHASPIPPIGPGRKMPPGIALDKLGKIDVIIISHNHYDHLDIPTLENIINPEEVTLVAPLGVGQYFEHVPFKKVIELDWYERVDLENIRYTALPVVHYSARSLFDVNETLWAGFSIHGLKSEKKVFFFEGDYSDQYKILGEQYGPFDLALIASGAYTPRSIMKGAHCYPATCVQAGIDLNAKTLVPLHWGTVVLGTENIYETADEFLEAALKKGMKKEQVWKLKIGETRLF